jgi:NADP-dependent 3-hydroxy acid dehydrogenase YdfG
MTAKVVVITGASSGIGAALAKQLGTRGYHLALAARRERELKQVAEEANTKAIPVVTDVRQRQDVEHLRGSALQAFGHIDVWINNAERGIGHKALDLTDEDYDEMMIVIG